MHGKRRDRGYRRYEDGLVSPERTGQLGILLGVVTGKAVRAERLIDRGVPDAIVDLLLDGRPYARESIIGFREYQRSGGAMGNVAVSHA